MKQYNLYTGCKYSNAFVYSVHDSKSHLDIKLKNNILNIG